MIIAAANEGGKSQGTLKVACSADCPSGEEQFLFTVANYEQIENGITMNLLDDKSDTLFTRVFNDKSNQPIVGMCIPVNRRYRITGLNYDK